MRMPAGGWSPSGGGYSSSNDGETTLPLKILLVVLAVGGWIVFGDG